MIGLLILLGLLIIEVNIYFLSRKYENFSYKILKNIRISTLILIMAMFLFGLLTWSFRYYGLMIVLMIMTIISHFYLLKDMNQINDKAYQVSKKMMLLRILIFALVMTPSFIFPDYQPLETTGNYEVKTSSFILEDNNRIETFSSQQEFRQLGVHVWYPKNINDNIRYPLIIYSHGGISLNTSNESLFLELASQGYVVFSIDHFYHSIVAKNSDGKNVWINSEYMQELNRENAKENAQESFELYQKWMELRTGDLNFIIDYTKIEAQRDNATSIFKYIDPDNIGLIGHSLGGSAVLCIGRERSDVKVIIALESPYMCDILSVEDGDFVFEDDTYPVPVLNIYSDSTWDNLSLLPQYKQNNLMLKDNDSVVSNVYIDGTGHFSLTDLSLTSPIMARMLNGFNSTKNSREVLYMINKESLDFLNEYLK